jgi:hypothetical protein
LATVATLCSRSPELGAHQFEFHGATVGSARAKRFRKMTSAVTAANRYRNRRNAITGSTDGHRYAPLQVGTGWQLSADGQAPRPSAAFRFRARCGAPAAGSLSHPTQS